MLLSFFWKLPEFGWHLIKLLYFIRPTRLPDFWQCWAQATFLNSHQRNMCHFFNFCVTTPLCCYFNTTQSHDSLLLSPQIYVFGVLKFHLIYIFIHKIWFTKWRILAPFYFHATANAPVPILVLYANAISTLIKKIVFIHKKYLISTVALSLLIGK